MPQVAVIIQTYQDPNFLSGTIDSRSEILGCLIQNTGETQEAFDARCRERISALRVLTYRQVQETSRVSFSIHDLDTPYYDGTIDYELTETL